MLAKSEWERQWSRKMAFRQSKRSRIPCQMTGMDSIYAVSIWLLPVLIAITFHEAAHGYVARFLGDDTASRLGRVSLNPVRHIDPFASIIPCSVAILVRIRQTSAG